MTSMSPRRRHSPTHRLHATARALRCEAHVPIYTHYTGVEKWDVATWNNQVLLSQESSASGSRSDPRISDSAPCVSQPEASSGTQSAPATSCFSTTASAFGFGNGTPTRPRSIPRRKSSHVESHQTRLDALAALHRSVGQHDADFLARMRELERCHLLPESLSSDLATPGASRGRKRNTASWDEDGDVEMSSWNERRRMHRAPRSNSPVLFGSAPSTCDDKAAHSSDDEYVVADHDGSDSHSCSDDEDDDLDIVIVPGGSSAPSLDSSPSSLSTSLSSLPARAGSPNYTPSPRIPGTIKCVDELAAAMAGGAGSVVEWSVSSDVPGDESHFITDIAQAGALWA